MRIKAGFAALMTACALTAGLGAVDVFANVPPEAEIAAEAAPAEPEVTQSVPEVLVPAGDTTDPVPTKVVEKPAVTPEPVEKKKANLTPILVPAVLLAGGGAGYAYYRYRRKKQAEAEKVDPDADYREVLVVVNLNSGLKPLNFNIVSIGDLTQAIASIPNLLVSGILSNAASFLVLHNHPSGELTPSQEDIAMTKRVIEAGQLVGIPCVDHIIVAGGESGLHRSMREVGDVEFDRSFYRTETGKEQVGEMKEEYKAEKTGEVEELSIKFGKGLWTKLPADGHVTVSKSVAAVVENGKTVWNNEPLCFLHRVPDTTPL